MPKIRNLLNHAAIETAIRKRICHRERNEHSIPPGQHCLVVKDAAGGKKNYCPEHGSQILENTRAMLNQLQAELNG